MSDNQKLANRIPFEAIESISSWDLPSLGGKNSTVPTAQREAKQQHKAPPPPPPTDELIEEVEEEVVLRPMTADQLQQITEEAEREGREQGYQVGLQQGLQEGQKQGQKAGEQKAYAECKAQLEEETERLRQISERLMAPLATQELQLENLLLEMAVKFAQHLLQGAITADPSALYNLIEKAVASVPAGAKNLRIVLNPDDLALFSRAFDFVPPEWTLTADRHLSRGGCRVESQYSLVDYSVEKRLAQLFEQSRALGETAAADLPPPEDHRPAAEADEHESPGPEQDGSLDDAEPQL